MGIWRSEATRYTAPHKEPWLVRRGMACAPGSDALVSKGCVKQKARRYVQVTLAYISVMFDSVSAHVYQPGAQRHVCPQDT